MNYILLISLIFIFIISIIFSIYLKFPQIKALFNIKRLFSHSDHHAFLTTLGTNIGTGNLVGITSGISLGGPGVILWMWIFAFFGCCLSFAENAYAVKYQSVIAGERRGGASYYILKGLNSKFISILFAISLLITNTILFPPVQINAITVCTANIFNLNKYLVGTILFVVLGMIVFSGTKAIVKAQDTIVPIMSIAFMIVSIFLIIVNYKEIPLAVVKIINSALSVRSVGIGMILNTMLTGFKRSLFSNEAGLGTTPSVTGISTRNSLDNGYLQVLVVYVDTLIMCTITGLVVVISGLSSNILSSSYAIIDLFETYFSSSGALIGYLFIIVFALSSVIGQFYLGESNIMFLGIVTKLSPNLLKIGYRVIYSIGIIIGIIVSFKSSLELLDVGMVILGLLNIMVIITLEKREKYLHKLIKGDIM